ncbi:MAG: Type 1 glutamine amidotransferase-like domain-containing protein [Candidatus Moraniibacteriota bacterium]
MKIFLTSTAADTLEKLLPSISKNPSEMKVAFIPTAGDLYPDKPWQERDRDTLKELGFQVEDIDLKVTRHEELKAALTQVDIIFVAGGNTSYLLEQAQKSGFLNIAKDLVHSGTIYIGSSAGSLLAGPNIEVDKIYSEGEFEKELMSYEGLGLVDFVILPHANKEGYRPYIERIKTQYGQKYPFVELGDNQAIVLIDGKKELLEVSK